MPRLRRECVITEKIDGTNAQISIYPTNALTPYHSQIIGITGGFAVQVGSRTRWINPESDNYGFAKWCYAHLDEIVTLGEGRHFGEWWGNGIQRNYGAPDKRLSLFNGHRWCLHGSTPNTIGGPNPTAPAKLQDILPPCIGLVPTLFKGTFSDLVVETCLNRLFVQGSVASPGFMKPEGIIVHHVAAGHGFKVTLENDGLPKSLA